jgi:hypothetical protein
VSFDKFGWLKALQSDPRYTDKERCFGSIVCVQFARRDGTGWAVDLDDIAAKMPGGMSHNRMKIAFGKFVRDGYLTETGRSPGGRGVKARRSHDLTKPAPAVVQVSDETRTRSGAGLGETRTSTEQNPHPYGIKPAPVAFTKTYADLREDPLKVLLKVLLKGLALAPPTNRTFQPPQNPPKKSPEKKTPRQTRTAPITCPTAQPTRADRAAQPARI